MDALLGSLTNLFNLLLVVVGFGMVVFIHEMGHFLTARWAGIRVFAFALGFGPAVVSYRKGLGWRKGSSEPEYMDLIRDAQGEGGERRERARALLSGKVSPTEYRFNALPFGGYVKMLGQSDIAPEATATAPDSYLAKPIWKRMVVISGGVVMNLLLALAIFMFVFFVGIETEPAKIGLARADSPAAAAVASNAEALGIAQPGLRPGDVVVRVNGRAPDEFNDIVMTAAMTGPGEQVRLEVSREGVAEALRFVITPERDQFTGLLDIGVEPPRTLTVPAAYETERAAWDALAAQVGLAGVGPGMTLESVDGRSDLRTTGDLIARVRASGGSPLSLVFAGPDGGQAAVSVTPRPELMIDDANADPEVLSPVEHLLGLMPVMKVGPVAESDRGYAQGLREGDIFARLGGVEFPSVEAGIREVQRHAGKPLELVLLRADGSGGLAEHALTVTVSAEGLIGFPPRDTGDASSLVTRAPPVLQRAKRGSALYEPALVNSVTRPGSRVLSVAGTPVADFSGLRAALVEATRAALESGADHAEFGLVVEPPLPAQPDGTRATETVTVSIPRDQIERLHGLSWRLPFSTAVFEPEPFLLRATGPIDAIRMGFARTQRMMAMTYLTLARLVQGTVKVDNLKGPVGIAHLGTQVATRGYIWLLFFMGLISVNLAVVNFLPLPIADGGQFLMLLYEQVRGRPLPLAVQNAITAAGLVMLVSMFLLVTYNDVARLFGG
jgi:regulator of sigma E protease